MSFGRSYILLAFSGNPGNLASPASRAMDSKSVVWFMFFTWGAVSLRHGLNGDFPGNESLPPNKKKHPIHGPNDVEIPYIHHGLRGCLILVENSGKG